MPLKTHLYALFASTAILSAASAQNAPSIATGRYSGTLRGSSFSGVTDVSRISGNADISALSDRPGVFKVELRFSMSSIGSESAAMSFLQWSISPGRCGSRIQLLLAPTELPGIEVRPGGNAEVAWQGPINLAANAGYQVVVLNGGTGQQNIVACGNLKYSESKK